MIDCEVLAGGASGAGTYRLHFLHGDLVLKVTTPAQPGYIQQRARREILFYRHLAARAGIAVPSVIASRCSDAIGTCLLLRTYAPTPDPTDWTTSRHIQAADQLGRFHAEFWGRERELSRLRWLRELATTDQADIRRAYRSWRRLRAEDGFEGTLTPERYERVLGLLAGINQPGRDKSSLPVTLCHGDFHIGNILVDTNGGLFFADWQAVGPGIGPEDLSFFIQRACHSGGTVPIDTMVEAYRGALVERLGTDVKANEIRRVMEIAELRTRLLHWPAFLASASELQMAAHLDRIEVLAARVGTGAG